MQIEDLPLVLKVKDIEKILQVGRVKAYEITRRKDFPAIRDGNRILIPRDAFFRWLDESAFQRIELVVR